MLCSTRILVLPVLLMAGALSKPGAAWPSPTANAFGTSFPAGEYSWLPVKSLCKKVFVCLEPNKDKNGKIQHGCAKYKIVKVCNEGNGSEMPPRNPPKVHVPPFERRLQVPGQSYQRQAPAFNQGSPFGRGMQMPGSRMSTRRR
jgi:hypothetical protein